MSDTLEARISRIEQMLAASALSPHPTEQNSPHDEYVDALKVQFVEEVQNFGPIQPLIEDDSVTDILINQHDKIFIERHGKLEKTDIAFDSDASVMAVAEKIVAAVNRHLNPYRPLVDARLLDGSRVNIIAPPLAVDGTAISIRKFAKRQITLDTMIEQENVSHQLGELLKVIGRSRLNVIISGGTGSGKTTLLNAISHYIEDTERVVTIEDAAELRLQQPHVVRLETKPITFDHGRRQEEVTMRDLVKNALRMRPDRILVGEVRGSEAFDMMQAMNTGHEGSLSTIHANHPRDALARMENMVNMANLNLPSTSIRQQMASAVNVIIQISRMRDGHRRVTFVSEVIGMEGDVITMQDLFSYGIKGDGKDGRLMGEFKWTGIMPRFLRRAAYYGEHDRLANALGVKLPKV